MERPRVLLAAHDDAAAIAAAMARAGFEVIGSEEAFEATIVEGRRPALAVIDADLAPSIVRRVHRRLNEDGPVSALILLGDEAGELDDVWQVTDEFVIKPALPDAIVYRLQALLIRSGQTLTAPTSGPTSSEDDADYAEPVPTPMIGAHDPAAARVVAVFAPKGGVGKTTVSVNLAVALRVQNHHKVLLLDADAGVGNVTAVIDVPARRGLADMADSSPEFWTDDAFQSLVAHHEPSGLDVLTWGFEPADAERIGPDLMIAAVRWARPHYEIVIVDTHPGYDDRTVAMLSVANEILLTVTPEVGPLRNSAQFLQLAHELGIDDTIRVVANRANHGVAIRDMEGALGRPVIATIVSAGATAVMAANAGTPLVLRFPKERITADIHRLARIVAGTEQPTPVVAGEKRRWSFASVLRAGSATPN
ncbi:MAG TPA: AAA family ATPase [Candidatus Limnocylindria bacterium]